MICVCLPVYVNIPCDVVLVSLFKMFTLVGFIQRPDIKYKLIKSYLIK